MTMVLVCWMWLRDQFKSHLRILWRGSSHSEWKWIYSQCVLPGYHKTILVPRRNRAKESDSCQALPCRRLNRFHLGQWFDKWGGFFFYFIFSARKLSLEQPRSCQTSAHVHWDSQALLTLNTKVAETRFFPLTEKIFEDELFWIFFLIFFLNSLACHTFPYHFSLGNCQASVSCQERNYLKSYMKWSHVQFSNALPDSPVLSVP